MRKNILITAMPRTGKSTLLRKIIEAVPNKVGFVTNELRENNERIGFEVVTSAGQKALLAHVSITSDILVSRYHVDINALEQILPSVKGFKPSDLLYLDEIGQMQLYSKEFERLVLRYLDAPNICVAVLSKIFSNEFTESIKRREDVVIVDITMENRDGQQVFIESLLRKIEKAKHYASEPKRFVIKTDDVTITTDHGKRRLVKKEDRWHCDCPFFAQYGICSHLLALDALQERTREHSTSKSLIN
jgi:nucleoside-triphosphatase